MGVAIDYMASQVDIIADNDTTIKEIDSLDGFFNPERDLKNIGLKREYEIDRFKKDLANEIRKGPGRKPFSILFESPEQKVCVAKISVAKDGGGKRSGYRAVMMLIYLEAFIKGYLLLVSSHQEGMEDLTDGAKEYLRNKVEEIYQVLQKGEQND